MSAVSGGRILVDAVAHGRFDLLSVHQETAVAVDGEDGRGGASELGAEGGRERKAEAAQIERREECSGPGEPQAIVAVSGCGAGVIPTRLAVTYADAGSESDAANVSCSLFPWERARVRARSVEKRKEVEELLLAKPSPNPLPEGEGCLPNWIGLTNRS